MRATLLLALRIRRAEPHAQVGLAVLGCHAHDAGDPDPEQRAGPADGDGGGHADDVAGADGSRKGGGECLVVGNVAGAVLGFVHERVAGGAPECAELDAPQPDGQEQAGAQQEGDEHERTPDEGGDGTEDVVQSVEHSQQ